MSKIIIPERLAKVAKLNRTTFEIEGATVHDVVNQLCKRYGELSDHFFYANGDFKSHFLIVINEEHASMHDEVHDNDIIEIMLATSGGIDISSSILSKSEIEHYSRHILLPNVGRQGQEKLKTSKVLIIGTGGLGSPIAMYLAAAGVGTLGLIDFDTVEESNLQRQVVHGYKTIGLLKVESAKQNLLNINKHLKINTYPIALDLDNAFDLIAEYDLVIDGSDNFSTRYLVNDACVRLDKPLVSGSIHQFDGQISVFNYLDGPCYRCAFPSSPPSELSPNCSAGGVIGVLPGIVGTIQATEALKIILGLGEILSGKLLMINALTMSFKKITIKKNPNCKACANRSEIKNITYGPESCGENSELNVCLKKENYIHATDLNHILKNKNNNEIILLDVRETMELQICAIPEVINIPMNEIEEKVQSLDKDKTYYVICLAGKRAEKVADYLIKNNFQKVFVLTNGMKGWVSHVDNTMPIY